MAVRTVVIFNNCHFGIAEQQDPQGNLVGRVVQITDPDSDTTYQIALNLEQAKLQGKLLMGQRIKQVELPNAKESAAILGSPRNGGQRR